MSGGLKQQWGVGDPAQVGPDAQSQDLKAAFEKAMDSMAGHLQYTAANGERARHDPLVARSEALVPRYQAALAEVDPADPAKAKQSIDSLLADTESLGQEVAAFRSETEKAVAEWQSRAAAYDTAVTQVEELQQWQHPKEGPLRSLVDAIRGYVNDRAYSKALAVLEQFLPKLQPIYEDYQKQKAAQQQYEPALAALQPRLVQAAQPSFAKVASRQSELAAGQSTMEESAQGRDFVAALATATDLSTKVDAYSAEVQKIQQAKDQYEQVLGQVQPKLEAAPSPAPFKKLESQQAELASGKQQMESSAQGEDFEQALQQANELSTKADAYSAEVQKIQQAKDQYEQVLGQVQPKLEAAPSPAPFKKLESQKAELASGKQQMESAAQGEEFEQALQQANDLGAKADTYTAAVEELKRLKEQYEQALAQVQPKLQAAPNPSPFNKLASQQADLASGQQQMESAAQSEEFEQALQQANDLGTKAGAYTAAVEELKRLKDEYEQTLSQVQPKLQAAPNPSPFNKLAPQQAELASGQQQMESAAQSEEFEQALQQANDLGTKADAYTAAVEELKRLKDEYEQALSQVQPKLQAAPNPSPFNKLAPQQAELASGQQQMESAAQGEEFEQALQQANDLGTKADAYTAAVEELKRLKDEYEQALSQVQPKLQAAPNPGPFNKLAPQQAELASGQQQMESAAQGEEFEQALQQANDLGTKVDAYTAAVEELKRLKEQYEQALSQVRPKLETAPNPSPFNKLAPQQAELASGQQQMESAAQGEEFEQALQQANDLSTKVDAYTTAVEELKQLKEQYEQALAQVQPKLQAAPNPSPFNKLASQQAELVSGQQQMESAAQSEEFEQSLQQANDLAAKVDAYTAAVEELTRLKEQYEQALSQVQPKLQSAPNPSPFNKLASQQAELASGQQQMESAAQSEDYQGALAQANELGTKVDAYGAALEELKRLKEQYEQALAELQSKLQAAPNPSPFNKLASQQAELASGQQQMESAAQAEEFEQALQQANDLGTKVDAYTAAVEELKRLKEQYEQALSQVLSKLQSAPNPSPFNKLASQQAELASGQQQMESAAQSEEFEQALQQASDLGSRAEAYTAAVEELKRLKDQYEQTLAQVQPKLQSAPNPSPFNKLASQQAELASGQQQMESAAQSEDYQHALQQANDLATKADAYAAAVEDSKRLKQEYEQAFAQLQPKLQAAPNPSPFPQLAPMQAELVSGQQQMDSALQAEGFDQALAMAKGLEVKVDAYTAEVEKLKQSGPKPRAADVTGTAAAPVLQSIAVTPANASIIAGAHQQMTATATLSDGTTQDITGKATWSSSAADVVAVDNKGIASAQAGSGAATITAADGNSNVSGSTNVTVTAPTKTWDELKALCNQYFSDHHFKAVKGEEIVPGDVSCDMYLDDHLVEVRAMTQRGQAQISAALVAAFPDLQSYPIQLAQLIAERWDFEMQPIRQLLQSIKTQPKSPPDGVLHRRSDGALFWQPNSAQITWGNTKPKAPDSWVTDYLNFFSFGPADDADANPSPACKFDSEAAKIDAVIATMGEQATLADYTLDSGGAKAVAQKLYDAAIAARQKPSGPSKGKPPSASDIETTFSVLWSVVPRTDHLSLDPDPANKKPARDPSHDKPGQQLQYNINVQIKSVTLTWAVQFTFFRDSDGHEKYTVQNILAGPQVAIDVTPAFLKGIVEFDPIAQALVGESRQEVRGSMQLTPTYQLATGLQITKKFQLPGSKIKFVLSAQIMGSLTDPRGAPRTGDVTHNWGLGFEW